MEKKDSARKLSAAGWALFCIWVAIAMLAKLETGIGLLGVGIITIAAQVARKCLGLRLEGFWVVVGGLFLLGGICDLLALELPIVPIVLILAGLVILASILKGDRPTQQ